MLAVSHDYIYIYIQTNLNAEKYKEQNKKKHSVVLLTKLSPNEDSGVKNGFGAENIITNNLRNI